MGPIKGGIFTPDIDHSKLVLICNKALSAIVISVSRRIHHPLISSGNVPYYVMGIMEEGTPVISGTLAPPSTHFSPEA